MESLPAVPPPDEDKLLECIRFAQEIFYTNIDIRLRNIETRLLRQTLEIERLIDVINCLAKKITK